MLFEASLSVERRLKRYFNSHLSRRDKRCFVVLRRLLEVEATRWQSAGFHRVQATPRDPLVLAGVVVSMARLSLLATWIPAPRAMSIDPVILVREE
jgi:hypothetical protein